MALNAESALPLQKETTDKKRKPMAFGKYFQPSDEKDEKSKPPATPSKAKPGQAKPTKRKSIGEMIAEG